MRYAQENLIFGDWEALLSQWQWSNYYPLLTAEKEVSEAEGRGVAKFYNPNLIPGTLQTIPYIDALCRGANLDIGVTTSNYTCKQTRQALLAQAGVKQDFLVREAALTAWPGGFLQPVRDQLQTILQVLRANSSSDNEHYRFRIIPTTKTVPPGCEDDAFCLYETPDKTRAFVEPWHPKGLIEITSGADIAQLENRWSELGQLALDPEKSLMKLADTLGKLH